MKRCAKCTLTKDATQFYKNRAEKCGLDTYCKRCYKIWKVAHFVPEKPRAEYSRQRRNSPHGRYLYTKNQAKKRKKDWDLSEQEYTDCILKPCFYCSGPLPVGGSGVDRIDNTKGYVSGNIVACCFTCNNLKNSTLTWQETLVAVKAIQEYRNESKNREETEDSQTNTVSINGKSVAFLASSVSCKSTCQASY